MQQTVPELLRTLSRELGRLAELTSALQDQISPQANEAYNIEALQSLDSLNQTLDCLATYVADVAALAPCHYWVEIDSAVDDVCLAALALRLRGDAHQTTGPVAAATELF